MRLRLAFVGILLLITGCASVPNASNKDYLPSGSKVAVFAVYNDSANLIEIGTTVFNNEFNKVDVSHWHLDQASQLAVEQVIKKQRFLQVVDVPYDSDQLKPALEKDGSIAIEDELFKRIKAIVKDKPIDAALVVYPTSRQDPFFGTNATISDYGLYCRSFLGLGKCKGYQLGNFVLFDLRSNTKFSQGSIIGSAELKDVTWPIQKDQLDNLKPAIEDAFTAGLNEPMKRMFLHLKQQEYVNTKFGNKM